jgi:nicotinamide-nucleotide adenylyltransferase
MITLFVGRFQPFHKGHLQDIKRACDFSDRVIIGIGSSQEGHTKENPFSFDERKEMIDLAMEANNITCYEIIAIPDINDDERWVEHVRGIVGEFDKVYTGNEKVKGLFEEKKAEVEQVEILEGINATEIRRRIDSSEDWEALVPKEVSEFIRKIEGDKRIKGINGKA